MRKKPLLIVLDNARIHHAIIYKRIVAQQVNLLFLPPYSSPLNPIELFFGHIKRKVYKHIYYNQKDLLESITKTILNSNLQKLNKFIFNLPVKLHRAWLTDPELT